MKRQGIIVYILFILATVPSFTQTGEKQCNLKIEAAYKKGKIFYMPATIFYNDIGQFVRITCEGNTHLSAEADNGNIINKGGGLFMVYPDRVGKLTMKVYDASDSNSVTLVAANVYDVIDAPAPEITLAGKQPGNITREEFLSDSGIHFHQYDICTAYNWEVNYFIVSIIEPGKTPVTDIRVYNNKIPDNVKEIIATAPTGTKILFEYISAILYVETIINNELVELPGNGKVRHLDAMSFTITDE